MIDVLLWLITVEIIGLAAFPLAWFLLPKLADRGYGLSKPFGILLIGYVAWILASLRLVPSVRVTLIGLLLLMAAASAALAYRRRDDLAAFFKKNWRLVVACELIFLAFFLAWALFRSFDPAADHTEQPMDMALLNASIASSVGQPEDPWLRGEAISYYYFGYWMLGAVSEISGVASNISYNLAMALIPALATAAIFSVVATMATADGARARLGIIAGLAGGVAMGVLSNLEGVLEFLRESAVGSQGFYDWIAIDGLTAPDPETAQGAWAPSEFWWWFRTTRVINTFRDGHGIDYTIQEFPFFSFMLGDLHPHMMVIPFAILFMGFALNFFRSPLPDIRKLDYRVYGGALAMGVALGGVAFANMWDLPTYAALLVGAAALKAYPEPDSQSGSGGGRLDRVTLAVVQIPLVVVALAVALYLPYYLGFTSSVAGIGANPTPTRYVHAFIVWGVPLVVVGPFIIASFWRSVVGSDWRAAGAISLAVAFLPFLAWLALRAGSVEPTGGASSRLLHIMPLALLIALAAWSLISEIRERGATGRGFALMLATLGLLLIMGPELMYVDDFFGAGTQRMNTVFKLYYQAWILLAAASGFAFFLWMRARDTQTGWRRLLTTLFSLCAGMIILAGLYYPAAASYSKARESGSERTLDALGYVKTHRPAEYAAIEFVKRNLPEDAAILESVGEWTDNGLISRSTGVPNIFNWPGHESQWRGDSPLIEGRHADVARIYETHDPEEALALLAKYDVDYIYIGPRELDRHAPSGGLDKFAGFADVIFQQGDATIYRTRR